MSEEKKNKTGYNTNDELVDEVDTTKSNRLTYKEQEITISYNKGTKKSYASCSIPSKWKEFDDKGWTCTKVINYRDGEPSVKFYEVDGNMIGIKNVNRPKRIMTEEQKQQMSERMKKMQEARKNKVN